jgi:hypothetical protein
MPKSLKVIRRNFITHIVCVLTLVLTISFKPVFAQDFITEVVQVDSTSALELKNRVNNFLKFSLKSNYPIQTNSLEEGTTINSLLKVNCLMNEWDFYFKLLVEYRDNRAKITFIEDYYTVGGGNPFKDFTLPVKKCKNLYLEERSLLLSNLKTALLTKTKKEEW